MLAPGRWPGKRHWEKEFRGWAVEVGGGWWVAGGRDICKWGPWDGVVPERGHAVTQLRTQRPGLLGAFREDVGSQHRWFVD